MAKGIRRGEARRKPKEKERCFRICIAYPDSEEQQEIIRRSGVAISIGFDGYRVEDYLPDG